MSPHQFYFNMQMAEPGLGQAADFPSGTPLPNSLCGELPIEIGAGATVNTIDAPVKSGLMMILNAISDGGGSHVITVASTVNQTGNNTLTFADAGDAICLVSVEGPMSAGVKTFKWKVAWNDGVALSTV